MHPISFEQLTKQVIGWWIDSESKNRGVSKWSAVVLARVVKGNSPGGQLTRTGTLVCWLQHLSFQWLLTQHTQQERYPIFMPRSISILKLCMKKVLLWACWLFMASWLPSSNMMHPSFFEKPFPDSSHFHCFEAFVRWYLRTLGWSERCATRPAQKLPANHKQILSDSFLWQSCIIRDYGIPPELCVNTDQTQTIYQVGRKRTWNKAGEKQVMTMDIDEKRAFTLVLSILASGELLPMQTIFHGQTTTSCPSTRVRHYKEALEHGFKFKPLQSHMY